MGNQELIVEKHSERIHHGLEVLPSLRHGLPAGLGNKRWTAELILATYEMALTGDLPKNGLEYKIGDSGGGFDVLGWKNNGFPKVDQDSIDLSIPLNKRGEDRKIEIPLPIYGGGMSFGSISLNFMLARARAAKRPQGAWPAPKRGWQSRAPGTVRQKSCGRGRRCRGRLPRAQSGNGAPSPR